MVASNYLDEVLALCDSAAVLHEGRLVAYEAPESLVSRAGQCLDLDCPADAVVRITGLVEGMPGVNRSELSASGLTVFLRGDAAADDIVRDVLREAHISGFRVRAADLADVFRVLDPAGTSAPRV
jgi:ABC-type multidrug transport system ATPase subunit